MNNHTFAIHTFGCKLNFSESSDMARRLRELGWSESEQPEAIVVNSCAVTHAAEKKVRNYVAHLHREHPDARIVVVGCYASLCAEEIRKWAGVEAVFGNRDKMNAVQWVVGQPIPETPTFFSTYSSNDRTRSFLKIRTAATTIVPIALWRPPGVRAAATALSMYCKILRKYMPKD